MVVGLGVQIKADDGQHSGNESCQSIDLIGKQIRHDGEGRSAYRADETYQVPRVLLNASPLTDDPATEESPSAAGTGSLGATARPALPCAASALFAGTFPGSSRSIRWRNFTFTFTVEPGSERSRP